MLWRTLNTRGSQNSITSTTLALNNPDAAKHQHCNNLITAAAVKTQVETGKEVNIYVLSINAVFFFLQIARRTDLFPKKQIKQQESVLLACV